MVVFVDLDQDILDNDRSALSYPTKVNVVAPVADQADIPISPAPSISSHNSGHGGGIFPVKTQNLPAHPNWNAFSAALSCYP
jgi:hypothetical protein